MSIDQLVYTTVYLIDDKPDERDGEHDAEREQHPGHRLPRRLAGQPDERITVGIDKNFSTVSGKEAEKCRNQRSNAY